jgi:hypothetical protein
MPAFNFPSTWLRGQAGAVAHNYQLLLLRDSTNYAAGFAWFVTS